MLKFILCDDNPNILNKLQKMLDSILLQHKFDGIISLATTNPVELLNYTKNDSFDVVILDIDLKNNISGLMLANSIREKNKKAYLIFTTAHLEYSMVAYKYKTFDFLAKPVTLERFEETIIRLYDDIYTDYTNFFQISKNKCLVKNDDIFYIQKEGKKAIFKTSGGDIEIYSSFSEILENLPKNFVRCHKSYIVNIDRISSIQGNNTITFNGNSNIECYIGPKYENFFTEVLNNGNSATNMECFNY